MTLTRSHGAIRAIVLGGRKAGLSAVLLAGLLAAGVAGCGGRQAGGSTSLMQPSTPPRVPAAVDTPLDSQLRAEAMTLVLRALESPDPVQRAHATEAVQHLPAEQAVGLVAERLDDEDPMVRFAALMTAGHMRLAELHPQLEERIEDADADVQVAAIYALHRLGDKRFSRRLEQFATHPDPFVRANTAMVLGLLEEPTAVRVLRPMGNDGDANVRLNVAEALWRLGDPDGFQRLLQATVGAWADDKVIGTLGLGARVDPRAEPPLRGKLTDEWAEVTLAAARGLGQIGSDAGYGVALQHIGDRDARRRAMAALAFGDIGRLDAQPRLRPLLADRDPFVRISAAKALLQLSANDALHASSR